MAVAPLQIPGYAAPQTIDFQTPLTQLGQAFRQGQQRQALSALGRGLADGSVDYRQAAAQAADMGDVDTSLKFLALDEQRRKEGLQLAATNQFNQSLAPMFGGRAAPQQPAGGSVGVPTVAPPNPAPRAPVASSPTVWGDDEGVREGIYDPPRTRVAQAPAAAPAAAPVAPAVAPAQAATPAVAVAPAQPAAGFQGISMQHVPQLVQALSSPYLPAPQKELAGKLLNRALDDAKPPDRIRFLQQMKQESGYPGSILDLEKELRASGKTEVKIDQKGETKFEEELGKGQAKRFNEMIETGATAQRKLVDIGRMREISDRFGSQGIKANVKEAVGPFAEALGIDISNLSDIQAYSSVVQRLAPQQRAPGSGSTSDIEFKGFLKSMPQLLQNPAARNMTLDTMEALTRDEMARGEIASRLAAKELSRSDAEKELRALPDPMKSFSDWKKANPGLYGQALRGQNTGPAAQTQPSAAPRASGTTSNGLNWSVR